MSEAGNTFAVVQQVVAKVAVECGGPEGTPRVVECGGPEGAPRDVECGGPEGSPRYVECGGPKGSPRLPGMHLLFWCQMVVSGALQAAQDYHIVR